MFIPKTSHEDTESTKNTEKDGEFNLVPSFPPLCSLYLCAFVRDIGSKVSDVTEY